MPVKFDWYKAHKTIGYYELSEPWTWPELHQVMSESWVQIAQIDAIVDSMMVSRSGSLPPNALTHLGSLARNRPANTGIIVLVGASAFQRSMINVFTAVYSSTLRREVPVVFADSAEVAYELLKKRKTERDQSPEQ